MTPDMTENTPTTEGEEPVAPAETAPEEPDAGSPNVRFTVTKAAANRVGRTLGEMRGAVLGLLVGSGLAALAHVFFPVVPSALTYLLLACFLINAVGLTATRAGMLLIDHQGVLSVGQALEWREEIDAPDRAAELQVEIEAEEAMRLATGAPRVSASSTPRGQIVLQPASPLSMSAAKAASDKS